MKKLLLLLVATTLSVEAVNAQIPINYQGEVDLGYSIGVGIFTAHRINIHTIQGLKIGKYFSAGLGVGIDLYHEDGVDEILPVYLNMKGYLPTKTKITPFISMDLGAGVGLSGYISGLSGFYCTPAVGVKVGKFKTQLGYNLQQLTNFDISASFSALQVKIGYVF